VLGGALVRYDRLSPVFESSDKVPLVGDLMVSRWAYEAIMVAQFKNNPYQKEIFDIESEKEEVHYRRSAYLPALENLCEEINAKTADAEEIILKRKILCREIRKSLERFGLNSAEWRFLETGDNIHPEQWLKIHRMLQTLAAHYNSRYKELQKNLDAIFEKAGSSKDGKNQLIALRDKYQNEQIARFLSEDFALQPRFEITTEGVIRKEKPGYQMPEPEHALDFRTHLFSPFKPLAGWQFPTELFNIVMIWLIGALTFLVLRFGLLKKLLRSGV
jgi:hypothetical protein